jgi:hypothetical protein
MILEKCYGFQLILLPSSWTPKRFIEEKSFGWNVLLWSKLNVIFIKPSLKYNTPAAPFLMLVTYN